jgi:hypothetical protein
MTQYIKHILTETDIKVLRRRFKSVNKDSNAVLFSPKTATSIQGRLHTRSGSCLLTSGPPTTIIQFGQRFLFLCPAHY